MADRARDFLGQLERQHSRGPIAQGRRADMAFAGGWSGGFAAGKRDRLTEDWNPGPLAPNTIHRMDAKLMRERARDLVENNPLAKSAVDAYVSNVIGSGLIPKPLFEDSGRRKLWNDAWNTWGGLTAHSMRDADITGQQTIGELMALFLEETIVGGGCLLHFVEPRKKGNRRIPFAVELIPEERFADELDTPFAAPNPKTANAIRRGIELDSATGRAVAYWVRPYMPDDPNWAFSYAPIRIPAEECEYAFFRKRIGQNRGHSLLHAAIMWLWKLGYYVDNELMNSAVKSCFSAMITTDADGEDPPTLSDDDPNGPATDSFGNTLEKLQPAMIFRGRPGEKISGVGPNTPGSDSAPWIMLIERSIAVGSGLSYEELCRDYSQGNFSSTRASANADRKRFRRMQRFTIDHFCNPIYSRFAAAAARVGIDGFPGPAEFLSSIDDWLRVAWMTPGWESVNPLDDAQANAINVEFGFDTRSRIIGERGADWEETFEQLDREQTLADDLDLELSGGVPPPPKPSAAASEEPGAAQQPAGPKNGRSQPQKQGSSR